MHWGEVQCAVMVDKENTLCATRWINEALEGYKEDSDIADNLIKNILTKKEIPFELVDWIEVNYHD